MTAATLDTPLRPGGPADAVAGVVPATVAAPAMVEQVRGLVREASGPVVARGGGSKLAWGAPPERVGLLLDLHALNGVLEHNPGDLVVRAQAGMALAALQAQLAAHGQQLGLDPPEPAATLGGIVATNASGPRRLRYGTVRDLLIGITVVLADGTLASSGGKVVKNVAGYDLAKLYTGSYGTLGVVVETVWRLHPLPAHRRVVTGPYSDTAVPALRTSGLVPAAVELAVPRDRSTVTVAVLFEGSEASVAGQAERAVRLLGGSEVGTELPAGFGERPWEAGEVGLRLAFAPAAVSRVLGALDRIGYAHRLPPEVRGHALSGVLYVGWEATGAVPAALERLRAAIAPYDGTAVVLHAPLDVRAAVDVWGPVGSSLGLMRRVKERLDPDRRLSPGRFVGGI